MDVGHRRRAKLLAGWEDLAAPSPASNSVLSAASLHRTSKQMTDGVKQPARRIVLHWLGGRPFGMFFLELAVVRRSKRRVPERDGLRNARGSQILSPKVVFLCACGGSGAGPSASR